MVRRRPQDVVGELITSVADDFHHGRLRPTEDRIDNDASCGTWLSWSPWERAGRGPLQWKPVPQLHCQWSRDTDTRVNIHLSHHKNVSLIRSRFETTWTMSSTCPVLYDERETIGRHILSFKIHRSCAFPNVIMITFKRHLGTNLYVVSKHIVFVIPRRTPVCQNCIKGM